MIWGYHYFRKHLCSSLTFQPINYIYTEPLPGSKPPLHCANITRLKCFDSFQVSLETPISWRKVLGVFGFDIESKNIKKKQGGMGKKFPYASGPHFPPRHFFLGKITPFLLKDFWISLQGISLWTHPGVASPHRETWPLGPFQTLGRTQTLVGSRFEGVNTPHFLYIRWGEHNQRGSNYHTSFLNKKTRMLNKYVASNPEKNDPTF